MLVGLQRERSDSRLAGFRTFPLVTVLGALSTALAGLLGSPWVVGAALLALALLIVAANFIAARQPEADPGMTTEAALLLMFANGAYIPVGSVTVAIVIGGGVAFLLHSKPQLHSLAGGIGEQDFKAIMQFVLITLVILPVLPNQTYGPLKVLNPFKIWLMVVLIVGLSLGGYVIYKVFGEKVGTLAAGVLGGFISSTATTVSYARRSKSEPEGASLAAIIIMTASAIVFLRVLLLMGATAPLLLPAALRPFVLLLALMAGISLFAWWSSRNQKARLTQHGNPSELRAAIFFAFLYAVVLLAVAASRKFFGQSGLWVVSIISGLTDMDAITLSLGQMVQEGQLAAQTGWRLVMAAALSNLIFKGGVVAVLGAPALTRQIIKMFAGAFLAGLAILLWWP